MGDTTTAQNNSTFLNNPQTEPIDANISGEPLQRTGSSLRQTLTCTSCDDENDTISFTAPCRHSYCDDCLASYVKSALEPVGVFPPVCCNLPITLQSARAHLPRDLAKRYQDKHLAILTSCSLLCAQSGCCVVIPPEKILDGLGHCSACNNHTCAKCRLRGHKSEPCPTDEEQREVRALAKKQGWQTCYRCNNMIELNFGCNHITCICRAEFCYVCGTIWKKCTCPQFHHEHHEDGRGNAAVYRCRTIFRAERAVERYHKHLQQTWGRPDPRSREEQIREVRDAVENGCDHGYWFRIETSRKQPGHCKLCKYVGHRHIYRCFFCPLTSCWACHTDAPPEYRREEAEEPGQQA